LEWHVVAFADDNLDRTFGALAHPIRRAILTRLARDGSASVSDLAEPFDVTLMAVSKHLRVMEEAGLIHREKDGRVHRCSFDPSAIAEASDWIEKHRRFWTQQLDSLAAYLEGSGAERAPAGRGSGGGRLPNEQGEDS
jgi:DNA-binding transcriptional ArsR family regulator